MAKNGTLKYYKQYVVLNDDGTVKDTYADLYPILAPGFEELDDEFYAFKGMHSQWGIMNGRNECIVQPTCSWVSNHITKNENGQSVQYTILVQFLDDTYELVTLDGRMLFDHSYADIDNDDPNSIVCILRDREGVYGLGDVRTGKLILAPSFENIRRLANNKLFVGDRGTSKDGRKFWGLIDEDGTTVYYPQYVNYIPLGEWNDYNLAVGESSDDGLTHYTIIDWNGKKVYETNAKSHEKYLRPNSYDAAVNAYIFIDGKIPLHGGYGRLVVIEYDVENDKDEIHEIEFKFSRRDGTGDIQDACYQLAKRHKLDDKIYY